MVWNSLPMQLAKENKKFFFGNITSRARMKDFKAAIEWLKDAGLIDKTCKVTKPGIPLKSYIDLTSINIFMLDIALLSAMSELDADAVLCGSDVFIEFKCALTERYVLHELISSKQYSPYYYSGDKSTYKAGFPPTEEWRYHSNRSQIEREY